jgi:hypothetical protein
MWRRSLPVLLCVAFLSLPCFTLRAQDSSAISTQKNSPVQLLQNQTSFSVSISDQLVTRLSERTLQVAKLKADFGTVNELSQTYKASMSGFSNLLDLQGQTLADLMKDLLETSNLLGDSKQAFTQQQLLQQRSQAADDKVQSDLEFKSAAYQYIAFAGVGAAGGAVASKGNLIDAGIGAAAGVAMKLVLAFIHIF